MCARVCSVLTAAGDLMVFTVVGVEFGVRVVEDGPAYIVLHGSTVALVMDLAAPTHQHSTSILTCNMEAECHTKCMQHLQLMEMLHKM